MKTFKAKKAAKENVATPSKIKILLVDDHPMVREGIRSCLDARANFRVVGEASDGQEAVEKAKKLMPDVVLMDISMPKLTGLEATKVLHKEVPKTKVLILTMHENEAYVLEIVRSGARGYLLKDTSPTEVVRAIEAVSKGEAFFSSRISQFVLNEFVNKARGLTKPSRSEISPREREVLALIAEGLSNKEIANRLFVSVRTVETHREHLMRKLDIHSAAGLTQYALSKGIVKSTYGSLPSTAVKR